jgi:hypothetical protein
MTLPREAAQRATAVVFPLRRPLHAERAAGDWFVANVSIPCVDTCVAFLVLLPTSLPEDIGNGPQKNLQIEPHRPVRAI